MPAAEAIKHPFYFLQKTPHPLVWVLTVFLELLTKTKGLPKSSQVFTVDCPGLVLWMSLMALATFTSSLEEESALGSKTPCIRFRERGRCRTACCVAQ